MFKRVLSCQFYNLQFFHMFTVKKNCLKNLKTNTFNKLIIWEYIICSEKLQNKVSIRLI